MDALPPLPSTSEPELSADLLISVENHISQIVRRQRSGVLEMLEDDIDEGYVEVMRELWSIIKPMALLGQNFRPWLKMSIEQTEKTWWNEGFVEGISPMLVDSEREV